MKKVKFNLLRTAELERGRGRTELRFTDPGIFSLVRQKKRFPFPKDLVKKQKKRREERRGEEGRGLEGSGGDGMGGEGRGRTGGEGRRGENLVVNPLGI